jgi:hypothetical protein
MERNAESYEKMYKSTKKLEAAEQDGRVYKTGGVGRGIRKKKLKTSIHLGATSATGFTFMLFGVREKPGIEC